MSKYNALIRKARRYHMSKVLITQVDFSSWIRATFRISPDNRRVAFAARTGHKRLVVVDGENGKEYDNIMDGTPVFSSNSQRIAYAALEDNEIFMVVDENEERKQYDDVLKGTLVFSPDSKYVVYGAAKGGDKLLVVDGEERDSHGNIVTFGGGRIVFDSLDSLHYLAQKGADIYLVEEMV